LSSVSIDLSSNQGFGIQAHWSYPLFSGYLGGSIGLDGHVQLAGSGTAGLAGFGLNVGATVDLDPAHGHFLVDLNSQLNVYVATVGCDAKAQWSGGSLPQLAFTGHAAIGGILAQLLSGSVDFTIATDVVHFGGTLGIPSVPGATLHVS